MKTSIRLTICNIGCVFLKIFMVCTVCASLFLLLGYFGGIPGRGNLFENFAFWGITTLFVVIFLNGVFWVGIIMVYLTSVQLGIRYRVLGIVCGWIPVANIVMLFKIVKTVGNEVSFERKRMQRNEARKREKICETKYPVLMVHGVFFRDFKHFNYWGRIPAELEENGAKIFYGNHNSAASVTDSAKELELRIKEIICETGCKKVNIIAHSKGGLDIRTAIALNGVAPYVASLTTINTPHRGCEFADYLLHKIPESKKQALARTYNKAAKKLGDDHPDFLAAVSDLTSEKCKERNEIVKDSKEVYYQSFGSKLNKSISGRFPLNFTYHLVKYFDGPNDGLVGEKSFAWGEAYQCLTVTRTRGISHGDMIDLNKENIPGFDVREFFVQVVAELKRKGF